MLFQLKERINVSPEDVFALVSDFAYTLPKIDRDMIAVEKLTNGPVGVGTRWQETFKGPGRQVVVMQSEFEAFDPPHLLEARFSTKGVTGRIIFACTPAGGKTDLKITLHVTAHRFGRMLYPLVRWDSPRREARRVAAFKRLVESGEMSVPGLRALAGEDVAGAQGL